MLSSDGCTDCDPHERHPLLPEQLGAAAQQACCPYNAGGTFSGGDATEWPTLNLAGADGTEYTDAANPGLGGDVADTLLYQAGNHTIGFGGDGDVSAGANGFAGAVYVRWKL
jgi:hypothetical protein